MNKPPAFQFYADDFLGGVTAMSNEEVGLYIRLLCMQWGRGHVTEDDINRLGRAIAEPSLAYVKSKFKVGDDGLLRNERMESERKKQQEFRESRAKAGKEGADKRWHSHSTAIAQPMANDSSPSPSPFPSSNKDKDASMEFDLFWKEYPNKVAKPKALASFLKARESFSLETIMAGLARWKASDTWVKNGGEFIANPTTFLNQERFNDNPRPAANQSPPPPTKPLYLNRYNAVTCPKREEWAHLSDDDFKDIMRGWTEWREKQ